jgi:hypothetical protein
MLARNSFAETVDNDPSVFVGWWVYVRHGQARSMSKTRRVNNPVKGVLSPHCGTSSIRFYGSRVGLGELHIAPAPAPGNGEAVVG